MLARLTPCGALVALVLCAPALGSPVQAGAGERTFYVSSVRLDTSQVIDREARP